MNHPAYLLAAALSINQLKKKYRIKPTKQCQHCGKEHRHNNSFCSAECCKAHRSEGK